jgi:hypothetical protein
MVASTTEIALVVVEIMRYLAVSFPELWTEPVA